MWRSALAVLAVFSAEIEVSEACSIAPLNRVDRAQPTGPGAPTDVNVILQVYQGNGGQVSFAGENGRQVEFDSWSALDDASNWPGELHWRTWMIIRPRQPLAHDQFYEVRLSDQLAADFSAGFSAGPPSPPKPNAPSIGVRLAEAPCPESCGNRSTCESWSCYDHYRVTFDAGRAPIDRGLWVARTVDERGNDLGQQPTASRTATFEAIAVSGRSCWALSELPPSGAESERSDVVCVDVPEERPVYCEPRSDGGSVVPIRPDAGSIEDADQPRGELGTADDVGCGCNTTADGRQSAFAALLIFGVLLRARRRD